MSAEKKAQARAEREEKRRREEQKDRRSMAIYTVVAIAVVVVTVAAVFLRSGLLQRSVTALDVNGVKYTAADVQYYYNAVYSEQAQYYLFNTSTSVKKQIYDTSTGQTWYDHLIDLSIQRIIQYTALAQRAQDEGHVLSKETQASLNTALAQLETGWVSYGYASRDAFIRTNFGANMTYDRLVSLLNLEYLASDYVQTKVGSAEYPDADYQTYYQEHADQLDTVTYSLITFRCSLPATNENGDAIERTDEERAAELEELKAGQKALAEEVQAKLNSGGDMEELIEEFGDRLNNSASGSRATYSTLIYYPYGDWLLDSARKEGDVTLLEDGSDTYHIYYVVRFDGRELDQEETHDVRSLLVTAGDATASGPTQQEYDEAEQDARALLDQWRAGKADEESFIALITENSGDTGSAGSSGLISNITSKSSHEESLRSWATDPRRREGDVELVKSEQGWRIVYYVSTNDPIWKQSVTAVLRNQDLEELLDAATQGWSATRSAGLRFVSA